MVDMGATFHIINDLTKFTVFNNTFRPEKHSVELADGTCFSGIVQKKCTAEVLLIDSIGQRRKTTLRKEKSALFIPSYPPEYFLSEGGK